MEIFFYRIRNAGKEGIRITEQYRYDLSLKSHLNGDRSVCRVLGSLRKVGGLPTNGRQYLQGTFSWWWLGRIFFSGFIKNTSGSLSTWDVYFTLFIRNDAEKKPWQSFCLLGFCWLKQCGCLFVWVTLKEARWNK